MVDERQLSKVKGGTGLAFASLLQQVQGLQPHTGQQPFDAQVTGAMPRMFTRTSSSCSCCMHESYTFFTWTHTFSLTQFWLSAETRPGQQSGLAFLYE